MTDTYPMEPLFPDPGGLEPLVMTLTAEASALAVAVPGPMHDALAELLRTVNTYHSNLIEGHDTRPRDIMRAMAGDYATQPERRALQLEAVAHVEVQRLVEHRLTAEPELDIASADFVRWVHREFYERLPSEFRRVESRSGTRASLVEPGAWRVEDVDVGRHLPPASEDIPRFMERFDAGYAPSNLHGIKRVVAIPASHHRLLWIHPFLDGNGRVARLFTDAFLRGAGLGAHGLWTASRGLARNRSRYLALLQAADAERWDDYDGRGARSARALAEFCEFFLETCIDQVRYMRELLEPDTLIERIRRWNAGAVTTRGADGIAEDAWTLLAELVRRGELPRGEAARALGTSERTARRVVARLQKEGVVKSLTPKSALRLAFPASVLEHWFPLLAPS